MKDITTPWIEVSGGSLEKLKSHDGKNENLYHAVFAAHIELKPFTHLENLKWGFSDESMLVGALARQRLFIEAQQLVDDLYVPENHNYRTLALRCMRDPSKAELQVAFLGKVSASNYDAAYSEALEYWQEIQSIFPYDYVLSPALTKDEYMDFSGESILNAEISNVSVTEISRYEGVLADDSSGIYLLGKWGTTATANEQIWRALAGYNQPLLLSIILQPTILFDVESIAIADMAKSARQINEHGTSPLVQREAQWIKNTYDLRLNQLRYPFLAYVHLIGQDRIPDYLPRVIGSALVQTNETVPIEPRYQVKKISDKRSVKSLVNDIRWLAPNLFSTISDTRFARMRYLVDINEADSLFHLPFPPKAGIPNVSFSMAKTT